MKTAVRYQLRTQGRSPLQILPPNPSTFEGATGDLSPSVQTAWLEEDPTSRGNSPATRGIERGVYCSHSAAGFQDWPTGRCSCCEEENQEGVPLITPVCLFVCLNILVCTVIISLRCRIPRLTYWTMLQLWRGKSRRLSVSPATQRTMECCHLSSMCWYQIWSQVIHITL